jgi:transposase
MEVVSRDRAGLYAEAAREGAPQARQVADRFHLLQNFRETVERQLGRYKAQVPIRVRMLDPMTGRVISSLTAAALCVKPRGPMTARQVVTVDALKATSPEFTAMRRLAMRFRGLLRGGTVDELDAWLIAARASGIYGMQRFARTIRQDIEAVRNAVSEPWSNGQTEGQINKLKTLKRAMYGRASVDLLRARMMPL